MIELRAVPALDTALDPRHKTPGRQVGEAGEAELLAAVAFLRDESAFDRLYHLHLGSVMSAAMHICRNKAIAEEIAQRAFMTLWQRAERLSTRSVRVRAWLVTVARNASIDYLRAENAYGAMGDSLGDPAQIECPQDAAVTNALAAELAPALALLSPEQRTVIELRYFRDMTFAAIAEQTGDALGTVKSRARLAIEHLRHALS
jgi:RNA polymerase sigma-70 factor (ECF subfamily)